MNSTEFIPEDEGACMLSASKSRPAIIADGDWEERYAQRLGDYLREGSPVPQPYFAVVELTSACQSACSYCDCWRSAGRHLSFENMNRFITEFAEIGGKHISFGGGEPLLYPRLEEALSVCRDAGLSTSLSTNGLSVNEDTLGRAAAAGLSCLGLSIDSLRPEVFAKLRGVELERVLRSAEILQDALEDGPTSVFVCCTVSALNVEDLLPVLDFAERRDWGVIYQPVHLSRRQRKNRSWLLPDEPALQRLDEVLHAIAKRMEQGAPVHSEPLYVQRIADFFRHRRFRFAPCLAGSTTLYLDLDSSLKPCIVLPRIARFQGTTLRAFRESLRHRTAGQLMRRTWCPGCWLWCYANDNIRWASLIGLPLTEGIRGGR